MRESRHAARRRRIRAAILWADLLIGDSVPRIEAHVRQPTDLWMEYVYAAVMDSAISTPGAPVSAVVIMAVLQSIICDATSESGGRFVVRGWHRRRARWAVTAVAESIGCSRAALESYLRQGV